jgi:hypothetical protein
MEDMTNNMTNNYDNQTNNGIFLSQHQAMKIIKNLDLKREQDEYKLFLVRDFLEDFDDEDHPYLTVIFEHTATKLGQRDKWGMFLSEDQVKKIVTYLQL